MNSRTNTRKSAVKAKAFSAHLRGILDTNLAEQREAAEKHRQQLLSARKLQAFYRKEMRGLLKKAEQGVTNLVSVCKSKEMQEMIDIFERVHGGPFVVFEKNISIGSGPLFKGSTCQLYMKRDGLYLRLDQGFKDERAAEYTSKLDDPTQIRGGMEETSTIPDELYELLTLHRREDAWVVEAVASIDVFAGNQPDEDYTNYYETAAERRFMYWLAFLVAASDENKLDQLIEKAFRERESS